MNTVAMAYEDLIARFVRWAQTEDNIRAALVIGSRARTDHPADEWSDLDIIILANDPEPYWATADWLPYIGVPWLTFIEPLHDGRGFERRVLFEGGAGCRLRAFPCRVFSADVGYRAVARRRRSASPWRAFFGGQGRLCRTACGYSGSTALLPTADGS
ncbi:MAG: aminoglycoside 6-adenylyltransferase [Anaerolineae bacterium]